MTVAPLTAARAVLATWRKSTAPGTAVAMRALTASLQIGIGTTTVTLDGSLDRRADIT